MKTERIFLPTPRPPRSLCWSGDSLVDWVSGCAVHSLDGHFCDPPVRYAYRFDRAVMSPDGRYAVLYEVLGTKGLVLKEGKVLREINRSFYHATAYEYPIALHTFPSGRTILAHCPDDYCRLEIEDIETGQRLTQRTSQSPDFFHSRLQFRGDGRYLLSAGWIWHPIDSVRVFDVSRALEQPESLDDKGLLETGEWGMELHSAAFGEGDTLVLSGSEPEALGLYSLTERRLLSEVPFEQAVGTMMVMGGHVVHFFEHPTLIDLSTGHVVERWSDLATGLQCGSIIRHLPPLPPLALDPAGHRFAVGTEKGIEVVRFIV
ncbi:conserved uncharacterized protein [Stigmatella aurantiaca DW4/3-1]|uniref:Conserved uncharacterized protein n=1 Tax=Stigmatella aurantiaca (strain DW4/3-1) TaxID=378806 RepID=Q090L9_STIAD|nr:conserved uncharacterized protein [Stigmatella aurantiaca DW4/3-1]EAU66191.1 hypothetical protein STIAU_5300 [Stigmatella aurantiaca DW4/3-1]